MKSCILETETKTGSGVEKHASAESAFVKRDSLNNIKLQGKANALLKLKYRLANNIDEM